MIGPRRKPRQMRQGAPPLRVEWLEDRTAPAEFTFNDFSNTSGLTLVGSAAKTADNRLRLTPAASHQTGATWYTAVKQDVSVGFETSFAFQMSGGSDGMAFVIQDTDAGAVGADGGGMGYHGITNSIAVEFDTWGGNPGDPSDSHISIHTNGTQANSSDHVYSLGSYVTNPALKLNDGLVHAVRILYSPGTMWVALDTRFVLTVSVDLSERLNLDSGKAWVGFTAATGDGYQNTDVLHWAYADLSSEPTGLLIDNVSHVEGNAGTSEFVFKVTRVGDTTGTTTAEWTTVDDTATAASGDYVAASGLVQFDPGQTEKTIAVSIKGDTVYELNETFRVVLSNAIGGTCLNGVGVGTIVADDLPPGMDWLHQFGTAEHDEAFSVVVDAAGNLYVAGPTYGTLPGLTGAGNGDAFVRKYDVTGNEIWTRQFGTSGQELCRSIAADNEGNVYVAGSTWGALPGQTSAGVYDTYVRKYDAAGNEVWTRQFGTSADDIGYTVAVDGSGNIYVAGNTWGTFPGQSHSGQRDPYVRKYNAAGNEVWTRQFGAVGSHGFAFSVAVDRQGNIYVAGVTGAPSVPSLSGPFVRKYDPAGSEIWTRQFGTSYGDAAYSVAVDGQGNVYLAGYTGGTLPGQANNAGGQDAYVRKYDTAGNEIWTRQFGTDQHDNARSVGVDGQGYVYVAGGTGGTFDGQSSAGSNDAFVRKYDPAGNEVTTFQFGTVFGDIAYSVAVDRQGKVYLAGGTDGTLPGQTNAGGRDVFLASVVMGNNAPVLGGANPTLIRVPMNSIDPPGDRIADLLAGAVSDPNPGALRGIAVVGLTGTSDGSWQYSSNNGQSWQTMGTASINAALLLPDGYRVRFVPKAGFLGTARITYHAWDRTSGTAGGTADVSAPGSTGGSTAFSTASRTATVRVGTNVAPVAVDQSLSTTEGTPLAVTLKATDAEGDALTYQVASGPVHGTLSGTGANRIYTPAANYHGPDSFTFTVSDGHGGTDTGTVSITVTSVNVAPVAIDQALSTAEDAPLAVTLAATDADGDTLTYQVASGPAHGTLSGAGASRYYTPAANYHGPDSFSFLVSDGHGGIDAGTVSITVRSVNDAPAGADTAVMMFKGTGYTFAVADFGFSDPSDSPANALLAVKIVSLPAVGTLAVAGAPVSTGQFVSRMDIASGLLRYMPPAGATGSPLASFTFQVQDDGGSANGGTDLDPTPNTIFLNVLPETSWTVDGTLDSPADADTYRLDLDGGRLTAHLVPVDGNAARPRLRLLREDQQVLAESSGTADGGLPNIQQHLDAGTYFLVVSASTGGCYRLCGTLVSAVTPFTPVMVGDSPASVVAADLNADGKPDLVTANAGDDSVSVLLGVGDGSFAPSREFATGSAPYSLAVADLNADGLLDLVTGNGSDNTVTVLLGNGAGSFTRYRDFATGSAPASIVVADLDDNGIPDLVTSNNGSNDVSVLLGLGEGVFAPHQDFATGRAPFSVAAADVNGDGTLDLVTANWLDDTVSLLLGLGGGSFATRRDIATGGGPASVAAADVNGDGRLDLVTANQASDTVSVLVGHGDGSFSRQDLAPGSWPAAVVVADINADGTPDLVTANWFGDSVSVLLGQGHGLFASPRNYATGNYPAAVTVVDVNADGRLDLVAANQISNDVSILLGTGDSSFPPPPRDFDTGSTPSSVVVTDVDVDGKPDLVCANESTNDVSVLLGNGDGAFAYRRVFATGRSPAAVAAADVNADGKADLVTANSDDDSVSVLLGNGDGSFAPRRDFFTGSFPNSVAVKDVNGDGKPDLVTANRDSDSVSVLLGSGDGSFGPRRDFVTGHSPRSVAVGDVDGDGIPDLVVANSDDNSVSVLLGIGDGSFAPGRDFTTGAYPTSVAVADINADGKADVVTANLGGSSASLLLGKGDGSFGPRRDLETGTSPRSVAVADVDADGRQDLVIVNAWGHSVGVLLGIGDGSFASRRDFDTGVDPTNVAVADVNVDGILDLVTANWSGNSLSVLLGLGEAGSASSLAFVPTNPLREIPIRNTPLPTDLDGQGTGTVILDRSGNILLRKGTGSSTTPFAAPTILNSWYQLTAGVFASLQAAAVPPTVMARLRPLTDRQYGSRKQVSAALARVLDPTTLQRYQDLIINRARNTRPARDVVPVRLGTSSAVAALDIQPDLTASNRPVYIVSLYTLDAAGHPRRSGEVRTTAFPTRIAAGDLSGSGLDDLVLLNSLDDSITIIRQIRPGQFAVPGDQLTRSIGVWPSSLSLADLDGDGRLDMAVAAAVSGDVTVLLNDASHTFVRSQRVRGGPGPFGSDSSSGLATVLSLNQPVNHVVGDFTGDGRPDLVVLNRGGHSFSTLINLGNGLLADPTSGLTFSINDGSTVNFRPGAAVAGRFRGPNRPLDLAILMEDRAEVWVFSNDGLGHFRHTFSIPAGSQPTGLRVAAGEATGQGWNSLDLLVGNPYGDILRVKGNGDGTFTLPPPGMQSALVTAGARLRRSEPILVVNQQTGNASLQVRTADGNYRVLQTLPAPDSRSQQAPSAGLWVNLNGGLSRYQDVVIVGAGSNDVLVYRFTGVRKGVPTFAMPERYPVGTHPVAVLARDLNQDGILDLVVTNQGSNDVSVLFGARDSKDGHWTAIPGPRINSGGIGPVGTLVRDQNRDGVADLVVTNGLSGTMTWIPGRGQGYFDDREVHTAQLPGPVQDVVTIGPVQTPDGGLGWFDVTAFRYTGEIFAPVPGGVRAVTPVGDRFAVATGTGEVGLLGWNEDHTRLRWLEHFNPLTDLPEEFLPSALAVLEGAGLEMLVTSEGLDRIFVFVPGVNPVEPNSPGKPPTTTTTAPLPEAPLALVPTLTAVTLAEEEGEPALLPSGSEESGTQAIAAAGGGDELLDDTGLTVGEAESTLFGLLGEAPPIPLLDEILRNLELEPLLPEVELPRIDAPFQQDLSRKLEEILRVPLPPAEVAPLDALFQQDLSWLASLNPVARITGESLEGAFTDLPVEEVGGLFAWTMTWSTQAAWGIVVLVAGGIYGWGMTRAQGDRPDERGTRTQLR